MIIIMKENASKNEIDAVEKKLSGFGFQTHPIVGEKKTVIGAIGDKRQISMNEILLMSGVENVVPIMRPYKLVSKELIREKSIIDVGHGVKVGGNQLAVFAGPCAIEGKEQFAKVARLVKASGANILRGGAFKPRTSPYSFGGLEGEGLEIMRAAGDELDMPICTEVMDTRDVELVARYADIIQIGARNMQNFDLLKEVGQRIKKPVLLKRGLSNTYEEWLMSAEYIMANGNPNVILCERGIRTFETYTRNTLDLQAIPVLKRLTHLPVIIDPSHAGGKWWLVEPMAKAAVVAGCDGLMIEVHNDPENALCDGPQSLKPDRYDNLLKDIRKLEAVR